MAKELVNDGANIRVDVPHRRRCMADLTGRIVSGGGRYYRVLGGFAEAGAASMSIDLEPVREVDGELPIPWWAMHGDPIMLEFPPGPLVTPRSA